MKKSYAILIIIFFAIIFISPVLVSAQSTDIQEWPKGRIILVSGDTLYGPVAYHRTEDIIRITLRDGSINAFAPINVSSFLVSDSRNKSQLFRPYLWNRGNDYSDYRAPAFFELVTEGKYSLVKREILSTRSTNNNYPMYAGSGRYYDPYAYGGPRYQTIVLDLFYLYTPDQKIKALRNPKRDLEDMYKSKAKVMKAFVKENKLSYNEARDLKIIIDYYNSLL